MNETANRIAVLIGKHLKQELSREEDLELNAWIEESGDHREIFERLTTVDYLEDTIREKYRTNAVEATREKLNRLIETDGETLQRNGSIHRIWPRLAVAAAVLCLLSVSVFYILKRTGKADTEMAKAVKVESVISPGSNKATLKLADGRSIVLDSATIGQLAQQGSTQVLNKNGQLVYDASRVMGQREVLWNTLSTTKGQTYSLLLSDGSRITLNSASSIRFPVTFTGEKREVQVTGEVYFQVAHDASRPFEVTAGDMVLQVLGTTFNVNAYADEAAIKATLVEGSIQIIKGAQRKIIKPRQQAQVLPNDIKVTEVDVDKIIAWQQGFFRFKEDKLSAAMKNIARWYDVDVQYEGNAANVEISGGIPRSANISELIKMLAGIDVEARIEGRKLVLKAQ
jgi:ferric-dicitrate binding protein FerR (iron transport regulator)